MLPFGRSESPLEPAQLPFVACNVLRYMKTKLRNGDAFMAVLAMGWERRLKEGQQRYMSATGLQAGFEGEIRQNRFSKRR